MQQAQQQLAWLESQLGRAVGDAFAAALAVEAPAGTSEAWQQILGIWGVPAISDEERHRAAHTGMSHGAPADEVYAVLTRIGEWAGSHLPDSFDLEGATERRRDKLWWVIDRLRGEWLEKYKKQVMPAPTSMFAHAMASAQAGAGNASGPKVRTVILRCQNCGGPRMTESEFECEFCGHHLGEKGPRRQW